MNISRFPIAGIGAGDNWPAELLTGQHDADLGAKEGQ